MVFLEGAGLSFFSFTHHWLPAWAPEPFFPQASPWKAAFIVILTMMGLLVSGTSYLLIREHSGRLKLQQEWSHFQLEKDELQTIKEDALRTASESPQLQQTDSESPGGPCVLESG